MMHFTLRRLYREFFLSFTIVLSLALGVGLNTAVFSFLYCLFINPVPAVQKPNEVMLIHGTGSVGNATLPISLPNFEDLRQRLHCLRAIAAFHTVWVTAGRGEGTAQVPGELVTPKYFELLGPRMVLGRPLLSGEGEAEGRNEAVVGHAFWRRQLGGNPQVIGSQIWLNGHPFQVVGVAEPGFQGANTLNGVQFWAPLSVRDELSSYPDLFKQRSGLVLQVLGRLRPGIEPGQLHAELRELSTRLSSEYPDQLQELALSAVPLTLASISPQRRPTYVRFGAVLSGLAGLLLVVAGANSAILLLTSIGRRERDLAVRFALGASKTSLVGQLLGELAPLMAGAVVVSFGVAMAAWKLLWSLRPPFVGEDAVSLSFGLPILSFALLATVLATLIVASGPVIAISRANLSTALGGGVRILRSLGRVRLTAIDLLMSLQVAICFAGLLGATLLAINLRRAQSVELGFKIEDLAILTLDLDAAGYDEVRGRQVQSEILARARSLPTVVEASLGESRPLGGFRLLREIGRVDEKAASEARPLVGSLIVDASYFRTLGIPILVGRTFEESDDSDAAPVAIVNEQLREMLWGAASPIGTYVALDEDPRPVSVVGVARNSKYIGPTEKARPVLYLPLSQNYCPRASLVSRLKSRSTSEFLTLRREILAVAPDLLIAEARTGDSLLRQALWGPRLSASLATLFGLLGLALAAVGLDTIAHEVVATRQREVGLRLSIGATHGGLVVLLLRRSLLVVGLGLVVGLAPAVLVEAQVRQLMFGGEFSSWSARAGAAGVLVMVAAAGAARSYFAIARVGPIRALRLD